MYRTLCVAALLLGTLALAGSQPTAAPAATFTSPQIVAKGKLVNQTAPIPTTAIFTPTQTGLYRLSVYATRTQAGNSNWSYNFNWSDDAGPENANVNGGALIYLHGGYGPPAAFAFTDATGWPGGVVPFEAIAGVPVTYSVTGSPDSSVYSLYWVLERLE